MVHPTVIGQMPPFSFVNAIGLAPNKKLQTAAGVLLSRIKLFKTANAFKTLSAPPSAAGLKRSLGVWQQTISSPLEPLENDTITLLIQSTLTVTSKQVKCG